MIFSLFAASIALNPYGACAHITGHEHPAVQKTCAMMRQAGMGWVRCDFHWHSVEKKKGEWDFSRFDVVVSECEAAGIQLLPILCYSVPWANPAYKHLDSWEEYVRRVVSRYGRRLPVVEAWNEANLEQFWRNPNPTNYLALLRRTYETVKKVDSEIRVAFGGTSGVPVEFIEEVYKLGGGKWFDIMNVHPYSHPNRPEGVLDVNMEKLRKLMAKYGDGDKPVWITEVGWPTHRVVPADGGLMLAGLKAARPEAKSWRMLYVPAQNDVDADGDENVCAQLLDILPEGSSTEACRADNLAKRLAKGDVDAVVYPFSENYALGSVDAVCAFVKAGGVLVDFGGMPMWKAYRTGADGEMLRDKNAKPANDRRRLRISETAWWIDKRYPKSLQVYPAAAAKGLKVPPKGFAGECFVTSDMLKPGDEFIPLLSASTNGVEAVAAAVCRFGSDMKGAVVVSTLKDRGRHGTNSNTQQAKFTARALGIAFAEGVENFFLYEFRQPDKNPNDPESFFGMVHGNFSPKPAYGAYMTFAGARPAGSVQSRDKWRSSDGKTYFPQWKRPDGRCAGMIWTLASGRRNVVFSSPDMEFSDMFGARIRPVRNGNVYELALTDSPIYFSGGKLVECMDTYATARSAEPPKANKCNDRTKVLFFFDTEDFIQPRSCDAIRDMANVLASEGVKGHFALVGYLGKKLVDWRRFDVIDALKNHHIGTQTLYHSLHPNITEYTDIEDYDAAYLRAAEDESKGIGMLMSATGSERMWCSVLPGNGNTIVGLYLYANLGIPFFGGGTGMYEDVTKCGDIWYCNQRHLTYAYSLHLESFLPGRDAGDIDGKLDGLAKQQVATFYMHPHMAVCRQHWDYVFRMGNLHPFGEWPYAEARDPADTAIYYERIKAFLRMIKSDSRFEIVDCPSLYAAQNPRKAITRAEIPAIRKSLLSSLGPVRIPGEWSIADCFLAAVALLRGNECHIPDKVYGFLYAPEGVKKPLRVKTDDLAAAAKRMDVSRFLPASIEVGGNRIGPADFLFAALEAIESGAAEVAVQPREQLGDIAYYLPKMATVNFKGTWIYTPEYKDNWTSNRLRWQFWTFRYERPSDCAK